MVKKLEQTAENSGFVTEHPFVGEYLDGFKSEIGYSIFAEMYLENPSEAQMGPTCTICTWRGIPTIDDW